MLFDPPNFLVLDEPTNHLDLATKEMLVEAFSKFGGTMLFVSHDRAFLRGLSNRVLVLSENDSSDPPHAYGGSYVEWVARTGHEAPGCLLYTSDAADDLLCVDLGGRRIIKKKKNQHMKKIT